jgi:hypothetical protein
MSSDEIQEANSSPESFTPEMNMLEPARERPRKASIFANMRQ